MRFVSRRQIHFVVFLLLLNISMTAFYANVEDPFLNTFSMTGNRYDDIHNVIFLVWAMVIAGTTYYVIRQIILLFDDKSHWRLKILIHNSALLVLITLMPARLDMPFIRWTHIVLSGVYVILLTLILHPYVSKVFKDSFMRLPMNVWMVLIWAGGIAFYFSYGHNSIYEMWFFIIVSVLLIFMLFHVNYTTKTSYELDRSGLND